MKKLIFTFIILMMVSSLFAYDVYDALNDSNELIKELKQALQDSNDKIKELEATIKDDNKLMADMKKTIDDNTLQFERDKKLIKEKDDTIRKLDSKIHNYRFSLGLGMNYYGGNFMISYKPFESIPLAIYSAEFLMKKDNDWIFSPGIGLQYFIK